MKRSEEIFYNSFPHLLIYQPFLIKECNYRPDFYSPETGAFYEVSNTKGQPHINSGQLGSTLKIAKVFIVIVNEETKTINIHKYTHEGEVQEPKSLFLSKKKAKTLINKLRDNLTVMENLIILNLLEKSIGGSWVKEFLEDQVKPEKIGLRRIQAGVSDENHSLFRKFAFYNDLTMSDLIEIAVTNYIESKRKEEKEEELNVGMK